MNPNLQVCGLENVFAAGDISDVKEEKLAYRAESHAGILAGNITALAMKPKVCFSSFLSEGWGEPSPLAVFAFGHFIDGLAKGIYPPTLFRFCCWLFRQHI